MTLRHSDLFIPPDGSDPFINCKLKRKKYADILTRIVETYADGFVLAINNPWGEGKTTFVKMWKQSLMNDGFETLYYNAWENDFEKEVLVALISELSEIEDKPEKEFKDVLEKVLPLLGKVLPSILKHLVKRKLGDEASADIAKAFGDFTSDQLKEVTENYTSRKESIKQFKSSLETFVKKAGDGKPLVFIIDELDRCRPNYAVEVLEQIKHLFSVPGIVFILSIDKIQLGHAVRGVYGNDNIDSKEYLRRFIDVEFVIPKPELKDYFQYLYDYYDFDDFMSSESRRNIRAFNADKEFFFQYVEYFINNDYSLRKIEKLFAHIRLTLRTFKADEYVFPQLIMFISYLKENHNDFYENIKKYNYTLQELVNLLEPILINKLKPDEYNGLKFIVHLEGLFLLFYSNEYLKIKSHLHGNLTRYDETAKKDIITFNSKLNENEELFRAIAFYQQQYDYHSLNLSYVTNRYELMENLQN